MKPKFIPYHDIDRFVSEQQAKGKQWFWNGWTLQIFQPNPKARTHRLGRHINGEWGFVNSIEPNKNGSWVVENKYLT